MVCLQCKMQVLLLLLFERVQYYTEIMSVMFAYVSRFVYLLLISSYITLHMMMIRVRLTSTLL